MDTRLTTRGIRLTTKALNQEGVQTNWLMGENTTLLILKVILKNMAQVHGHNVPPYIEPQTQTLMGDTWPLLNFPLGSAPTRRSMKEQRRVYASCRQLSLKRKSEMSELTELCMLGPLSRGSRRRGSCGVERGRTFLPVAFSSGVGKKHSFLEGYYPCLRLFSTKRRARFTQGLGEKNRGGTTSAPDQGKQSPVWLSLAQPSSAVLCFRAKASA